MPVILPLLDDNAYNILAGEQMRVASMAQSVSSFWPAIADDGPVDMPIAPSYVVPGDKIMPPMMLYANSVKPILAVSDGNLVANNAVLATPCGALVDFQRGRLCMVSDFVQASNLFALQGGTKDSTGAALGSCFVTALETGRITVDGVESEAGTAFSDGSGVYSIPVARNTAYTVIASKPGSPEVTGSSKTTLTPTHIG